MDPVNPKEPVGERTSLTYLNPEFIENDAGRPIRILRNTWRLYVR